MQQITVIIFSCWDQVRSHPIRNFGHMLVEQSAQVDILGVCTLNRALLDQGGYSPHLHTLFHNSIGFCLFVFETLFFTPQVSERPLFLFFFSILCSNQVYMGQPRKKHRKTHLDKMFEHFMHQTGHQHVWKKKTDELFFFTGNVVRSFSRLKKNEEKRERIWSIVIAYLLMLLSLW